MRLLIIKQSKTMKPSWWNVVM